MMVPIGLLAIGITVLYQIAPFTTTKIFSDFFAKVTGWKKTNCADSEGWSHVGRVCGFTHTNDAQYISKKPTLEIRKKWLNTLHWRTEETCCVMPYYIYTRSRSATNKGTWKDGNIYQGLNYPRTSWRVRYGFHVPYLKFQKPARFPFAFIPG